MKNFIFHILYRYNLLNLLNKRKVYTNYIGFIGKLFPRKKKFSFVPKDSLLLL